MARESDNLARRTTAVILAGGRGTRIANLFPDLPKPLIPANGQPFLHWIIAWLNGQGVEDVVISAGYRAEQIADWAAARPCDLGRRLRCAPEPRPLGTGGGAINCLDLCAETVLVLNGDSLVLADFGPAFHFMAEGGVEAVIAGVAVPDTSRYGSLDCSPTGLLTGFREKRPGSGLINGGIYLLRRTLLERFPADQPLSMEYDVLPRLLSDGVRIGVLNVEDAPFLDIGTPETVAMASAFVRDHPEYFAARD